MKYYRKENVKVETVEKYIVIKLDCEHCKETISKGDQFCTITEYPRWPEDSVEYHYIHEKCLPGFVSENYVDGYCENFRVEIDEFYPSELPGGVDFGDKEVTGEEEC